MNFQHKATFGALSLAMILAGCSKPAEVTKSGPGSENHEPASVITNRIPIPENVRQNLGITFAKAEIRSVSTTLRVPGTFESIPSARREYRTALAGQVEILVKQYDRVTTGTPLYLLDSPDWRSIQQQIADAEVSVRITSAALVSAQVTRGGAESAIAVALRRLEADERHDVSVRQALTAAENRVKQLEKIQSLVGGKQADLAQARAEVAQARSVVAQAEEERADLEQQYLQLTTGSGSAFGTSATLETAVAAKVAEYEAAKLKLKLARSSARSVLHVDDSRLDEKVDTPSGRLPYWQAVERVEISALSPGIVQSIEMASGSYGEASGLVMTTLDPEEIRFRGVAMQSDLGRLQDGMRAAIVPPQGGSMDPDTSMPGTVLIGTEAHSANRTVDLIVVHNPGDDIPRWARVGVAAHAEVILSETEEPELAIPLAAVIQDDLVKIFFRRDPEDPDKVIRTEADLGADDGRWVIVNSGVAEGDQVVLEGVYELKLTGSGKAPEGGHFHADGTFHQGED